MYSSESYHIIDIVEAGFDAEIRYGGTIPEDLIAQRVSDKLRWVAVSAPKYRNHSPEIDVLGQLCVNETAIG